LKEERGFLGGAKRHRLKKKGVSEFLLGKETQSKNGEKYGKIKTGRKCNGERWLLTLWFFGDKKGDRYGNTQKTGKGSALAGKSGTHPTKGGGGWGGCGCGRAEKNSIMKTKKRASKEGAAGPWETRNHRDEKKLVKTTGQVCRKRRSKQVRWTGQVK